MSKGKICDVEGCNREAKYQSSPLDNPDEIKLCENHFKKIGEVVENERK